MMFFHTLSFLPVPRRREEKSKEGKGGRNEKRGKGKGKGKGKGNKRQKKLKTFFYIRPMEMCQGQCCKRNPPMFEKSGLEASTAFPYSVKRCLVWFFFLPASHSKHFFITKSTDAERIAAS